MEEEVICGSNYLIQKIFPDIQVLIDNRTVYIHQFNTHRRQLAAVKNQQDIDSQLIEELEETIRNDRKDLQDVNNELYTKFLILHKNHYIYLKNEIGTLFFCIKELLKEIEDYFDTILTSFEKNKNLEGFATELARDYKFLLNENPLEIGEVITDRIANKSTRSELNLSKGDIIIIIEKNSDGWAKGILYGTTGYFPLNCIKILNK